MKLYKYNSDQPINYLNTNKQVIIPSTYKSKDIRALWVSNVVNIDLPTIEDVEDYKSQVIHMLDTCLSYNINTIFFQVRTTNDAFYESKLNPYSRYLVGKEGNKPPFDVLKWVIDETKKRDISFHAWCNPYRVSMNGELSIEEYLATCDDLNFAKRHPEYLVLDKKGKLILNPGIKQVQDFVIESMKEIVLNYDVDGIHFDDYFYPYSGLHDVHDDKVEFSKQNLSLGDFRRNNVDVVVEGVHKMMKAVNPELLFGISPFGIWKNNKENEYGSNTAPACSESYYGQYADSVKWIKEGMIDYIVPQIYWEFGHKIAPFADICDFWNEVCKDSSVDLLVGHGAYRLGSGNEWLNKYELVNQVKYANQFDNVKGNVFFTFKTFIDKEGSFEGMQELKKLLNKE